MPAARWSSHKDIAGKALNKLAGPHVLATLSRLEQAVTCAHAMYNSAAAAAREERHAEDQPVEPVIGDGIGNDARDGDLDEAASPAAARWRADPPPDGGAPGRARGWRGIGPPAGRALTPKGAHDGPSLQPKATDRRGA
jgi:hypothetical protein